MISRGTRSGILYYAVVILVLAASSILSSFFSTSIIRRFDREVHYQEAMDVVFGDVLDAETGQRGFLLTGRDDYLKPFISAKDDLDRDLETLAGAITSQEQREWAAQLHVLKDLKMRELENTITLRRQDDGFNKALAVVLNNRGKHYMDQVRIIQQQSADASKAFFDRMSQMRYTLFYITTFSNALCVVLAILVLGQAIGDNLSRRRAKALDDPLSHS